MKTDDIKSTITADTRQFEAALGKAQQAVQELKQAAAASEPRELSPVEELRDELHRRLNISPAGAMGRISQLVQNFAASAGIDPDDAELHLVTMDRDLACALLAQGRAESVALLLFHEKSPADQQAAAAGETQQG